MTFWRENYYQVNIIVKSIGDHETICEIMMDSDDTIEDLKIKISTIVKRPVYELRLIHAGKALVDEKIISDYLKDQAVVWLVLALRGD